MQKVWKVSKVILFLHHNLKAGGNRVNTAKITMLTKITITGQISGNFTLHSFCNTYDAIVCKEGMFCSFHIYFKTKKEAKRALWSAFKDLRSDDMAKRSTRYNPYAGTLHYDASVAKINRADKSDIKELL